MSENRKYYYLKLKENFFTSEKMVILESMQDGLLYSNLLLKMYLMSLKYNGILMLNDRLPHTPQTIATFTRHQIGTVERAIKVFLGIQSGKNSDRWCPLHDRHPALDRAILHGGRAKKEGTVALATSESAPVWKRGQMSAI